MNNFLSQIYNIDNIIIYIIVAIIILTILFFVILLFGKKDQKLEETKKLETINKELQEEVAFKETNPEPVKVEATLDKYPDILIPNAPAEEVKETSSEPVSEPINMTNEEEKTNTEITQDELEEKTVSIPFEEVNNTPILKKEEEKPLVINEEVNSTPEPEITIPEPKKVEVTEFNDSSEVKLPSPSDNLVKEEKPIEIKIIDKKEENKEVKAAVPLSIDDFLPEPQIFTQDTTPVKQEEEKKPAVSDETIELELPQLRKDDVKTSDDNDSYSFNSIVGEKYNIK